MPHLEVLLQTGYVVKFFVAMVKHAFEHLTLNLFLMGVSMLVKIPLILEQSLTHFTLERAHPYMSVELVSAQV